MSNSIVLTKFSSSKFFSPGIFLNFFNFSTVICLCLLRLPARWFLSSRGAFFVAFSKKGRLSPSPLRFLSPTPPSRLRPATPPMTRDAVVFSAVRERHRRIPPLCPPPRALRARPPRTPTMVCPYLASTWRMTRRRPRHSVSPALPNRRPPRRGGGEPRETKRKRRGWNMK